MTKTKITHIEPALANGVDARNSRQCTTALVANRKPKAEPEVTDAKVRKAVKKASPKSRKVARDVPAILVSDEKAIKAGTLVEVRRSFHRNGEGWVELTDGRQLPDVFFIAPKAKTMKLALKQNKEVRSLLKIAAQAAGGTRLQPIGFASFTEFLAGVPLDKDGNAEVVFIPVKGNEPIKGKNVKLTIKGGKVAKVK